EGEEEGSDGAWQINSETETTVPDANGGAPGGAAWKINDEAEAKASDDAPQGGVTLPPSDADEDADEVHG
ncbi:MAG: hypothetical protein CMH57_06220, partial [Myxococcales bacterium]|nr:hypothetical protein [Myxococcales bacterium]